MPEMLRKGDFVTLLNDRFSILLGEDALELELVEFTDRSSERTESFSLIFRGPLERPFPQATYTVQHAGLGSFPLFLVPVAREKDGMRYEAVFNIVVDQ
jgi:hypothetical protein